MATGEPLIRRVSFHQLELFRNVAQLRSFSRAAEQLSVSQPSVSAQVKALEATLGTALVDRAGRGFLLTVAGERVCSYAQRVFGLVDDMADELAMLQAGEAGRVILGASITVAEYLLPSLLGRYTAAHPNVDVRVEVANTQQIVTRVASLEVHVGLVGDRVVDPDLTCAAFADDDIVLFTSTASTISDRPTPDELAAHRFVTREPGSATRRNVEAALVAAGVAIEHPLELGSHEAVKRTVAAGLGYGGMSRIGLTWELDAGGLRVLAAPWFRCNRAFYAVRHRGRGLTPPEAVFLELLAIDPTL